MLTRSDVSHRFLRYLLEHPDAGDTVDGILEWWLRRPPGLGTEEVQRMIDEMTEKGWLIETSTVSGGSFYSLNPDSRAEVERVLALADKGDR